MKFLCDRMYMLNSKIFKKASIRGKGGSGGYLYLAGVA